jgi:rhodanese-related sulfurtransferase
MLGGGDQPASSALPAQPPVHGSQPLGAPIELPVDDPAAAVDIIRGAGQSRAGEPSQFEPPPQTIDFAALGINPDGELTPEQNATVPRILLNEAISKLDDPDVIWLDVRSELEFEQGHIPGAINIVSYVQDDRYSTLPRDKQVIAYCSCGDEHTSVRAAFIMMQQGYTNVHALLGGWNAWLGAGQPTAR